MRTKVLLIAVAALAAGVITSQAQVYSQNIVGYVNQPSLAGFNSLANPLDASSGSGINDSITNIINVFSGNYDSDVVYIWAGTHYTAYTIDSSWPTGVGNAADTAAVVGPIIPPGQSIFLDNFNGSNTLTFVGTVHVDAPAAGTNVVGTTTNILSVSPVETLVSSVLPISGGISSVLQLPANGSLDSCVIYLPIITGGLQKGFTAITIDSGWPTGFGNAADTAAVPEPVVNLGTGFFFYNLSGAPATWVQNY
jgi:hypothetical protein